MTSYCEVCRGMFFTPHPHTAAQPRSSSCPCGLLPLRHSARPSASPSQRPATGANAPHDSPPYGLKFSHAVRPDGTTRGSASLLGRREQSRDGHACLRSSRSFSGPVGCRRSPRGDLGARGGWRCASVEAMHRRPPPTHSGRAATPPPLPPPMSGWAMNDIEWDGGHRYTADTFSSLQHADSCSPPFDFLRRGEGITGQRHPSSPPLRGSPRQSPPPFTLDSFSPQKELEERCCYPSPQWVPHDKDERGRSPHAAPTTLPRFPTPYSAALLASHQSTPQQPYDPHDGRLHRRINTDGDAQVFSRRSSSGHRHRSRRHSREHAHRRSPRLHASAAPPDAPQHAPPLCPAAPHHALVPPPSDPPQHVPNSLEDLIAKIRVEVRKGAAASREAPVATTRRQSKTTSGLAGKVAKADGAGTTPGVEGGASFSSSSTSMPVSTVTKCSSTDNTVAEYAAVEEIGDKRHDAHNAVSPHRSSSTRSSIGDNRSGDERDTCCRTRGRQICNPAQPRAWSAVDRSRRPPTSTSPRGERGAKDLPASASAQRSSSSASSRQSHGRASSSSAHLQCAVQEAEAVLRKMRRRARRQSREKEGPHSKTPCDGHDAPAREKEFQRTAFCTAVDQSSKGVMEMHDGRQRQPLQHSAGEGSLSVDGATQFSWMKRSTGKRSHSHPSMKPSAPRSSQYPSAGHDNEDPHLLLQTPATAATLTGDAICTFPEDLRKALEHRQEEWLEGQSCRIERLREGLSSLCVAVRKDLRKMREEVADVRLQSSEVASRVAAVAAESAQRTPTPSPTRAAKVRIASLPPECVLTWVAQCSSDDQRRLAQLLLPHLRPALSEVIQDEVRRQLHAVGTEHQGQLRELEGRLRTYVDKLVVTAQQNSVLERGGGGHGGLPQSPETGAPLWADFSSVDAFNAHLRCAARAVLMEEDDRRCSIANENGRRHELCLREVQRQWQETLAETQRKWRAEWRSVLDTAEEKWTRNAQAPLQKHADLLHNIVKALTQDVVQLHERQDVQAASVQDTLQKEREMRQREHAKLADQVERRVRELLPRQVDSACARYHVQRERMASKELRHVRMTHGSGSDSSPLPAASSPLIADELRVSVVQPALEHMRRLLVSHQEMMGATVEDRCRRAESVVEGNRHVWLQNLTELRGKVSALRSDVRGAFNELCSTLNVAAPAL
ncbi:hypothetical protein ABL78_4529 [Leptomonas seymouri]|uniref:Uncharacterized protein n=1 Tax=Leptomonas seymouri TaxID=5684 RepID=A0A0N1IKM8_LEPSE|nr:hypothetical protein ABL78_4529 [Leptomonas seymouri]|eukprot:KPI86413.1 hypothetical protein ABL78_4529 [Leptomonas seymouri]